MSFNPAEKFFGRDEHRRRVAAAINRRLIPHTNMHPKQLADALKVTPETIGNWRRGFCDPSSYAIMQLFRLFGPTFWLDVFGPIGDAMRERFEARRAADEAAAEKEAEALRLVMGESE